MLKLYHFWSSTCSRRVRICLAEKKLEWASHHVDILGRHENLEDWYVKLNPNNVVPTLDHDGRIVIESNFIMEYLDDVFPQVPLRPADFWERAQMRLWMDKFEHIVHSNVNKISYNRRIAPTMGKTPREVHLKNIMQVANLSRREEKLRRLDHGISKEEEASAEARLTEVMDEMEVALKKNAWLTGASFSLADISMAPFVERFEANKLERLVDWSVRPAIGGWWARLKARPSFDLAYSFKNPNAA